MRKGNIKTIIILLGIVVAILMTIKSPFFSAEAMYTNLQKSNNLVEVPEQQDHKKEKASGGSNSSRFNSGTRLLHVFTKNLPYLNNK